MHGVELRLWGLVPPTAAPVLGNSVLGEDARASLHKMYCLNALDTFAYSVTGPNAFTQSGLINLTWKQLCM